MYGSHRSRFAVVTYGVLCLIALIGSVRTGAAHNVQFAPLQEGDFAAPSLQLYPYDVERDEVVVTGRGFTPGGEVYLAIYDQMGRQLYENRTVTASRPAERLTNGPLAGITAEEAFLAPGGKVYERFTGLCGAAAMIRALDNATERWSNWQVVQPPCTGMVGPASANDLLRLERLPALNPVSERLADGLNPFTAPGLLDIQLTSVDGMIVVSGEDFTPGGRTYIAVYDLMGAKLYETRWSEATPLYEITGSRADVPEASSTAKATGGLIYERFAGLCGATVMIRAYDAQTQLWSNFLDVTPYCAPVEAHGFGPH
jgi:hypothetical protein